MDDRLVTEILNRFCAGDASLEEEVVERIHGVLHELAVRQMARQPASHTLQPTALIHEAWLRIAARPELEFGARRQFLRFAGKLMRNLLIDHARAAAAGPAEGELSISHVEVQSDEGSTTAPLLDVLDLEQALKSLEEHDPEIVRVVELRFYCGLSSPEIGEVLGCSLSTVERRWRFARAWLASALAEDS